MISLTVSFLSISLPKITTHLILLLASIYFRDICMSFLGSLDEETEMSIYLRKFFAILSLIFLDLNIV
jgi:hypothetical protein